MLRKMCVVLFVLVLGAGLAFAGTGDKAAGAPDMKAMQTEMMKCAVCKAFGARLAEIGPMTMEVVKLDNGMAIIHDVEGDGGLKAFHVAHDEAVKAGATCAQMTDEEAKAKLCPFCQEIRSVIMKGGSISTGKTKTGDVMVLTAADATVQKDIAGLQLKCAAMAEHMAAK